MSVGFRKSKSGSWFDGAGCQSHVHEAILVKSAFYAKYPEATPPPKKSTSCNVHRTSMSAFAEEFRLHNIASAKPA